MEGNAQTARTGLSRGLHNAAYLAARPFRSGSGWFAALGIFLAALLTALGWNFAQENEAERNQEEFIAISRDNEEALFHRLDTYRTALDGAAALFIARDAVTFPEWENYVSTLDLEGSLSGLNGIGFIRPVSNEETEEFLSHARQRGAPIERIHPESARQEILPIKYITPLAKNRPALGLDLAFEEYRREALEESRLTGRMMITKPITLVQDEMRGTGFLLVRPIYQGGEIPRSEQERMARFEGWSYSPIKARAWLSMLTPRQEQSFQIEVRQGYADKPGPLIFSSKTAETRQHNPKYTRTADLEVAGQPWTIRWASLPEFERSVQSNEPLLVLFSGVAISLCLGALLLTVTRREGQVRRKVAEATQELAERDRERSAMLEDLRAARDESLAAAKAKSTFLANMSHELRTPMNGVLGFADLLVRSDLPPEARRHAELIAESGRVMGRLLDDILDLSRIEADKMVIAQEMIDPKHICRHVMQLVVPAARKKGLELDFRLGRAIPHFVVGDKLRIQQVLINLVGNAVKFTDRGYVCIDLTRDRTTLRYEVRDSGIGIARDKLETIFEDFVQADDDTAQLRGGSGLGLAISRKLAQAMGGDLLVDSQEGIGSTFTLILPLTVAQAQPAPVEAEIPKPALVKDDSNDDARILLAEDHPINRMLMEAMAKDAGVLLDVAGDGKEAVAMAEHAALNDMPYDLVLMDVQMPVMDGLQATRALRAKGFDPDTLPIVALTANAFAEDVQACLAAGMQAHCSKPLTMARFQEVLDRWMPGPDGGNRRAA
ncbi:CHASE domain-containing protein [Altererythrobacter sp. MF3-039]|uniref:CHASE domain-containing protein n=1 Tax=Altererythrobacter sp. MF3-039 TaxID=3252901 RepID=UPI00390C94C4